MASTASSEMLTDENDVKWSSSGLIIEVSKNRTISTMLVRREAMLTDTMQSLLWYAQSFEREFGVDLVDVGIMEIVHNMIFAKPLSGNSRMTYVRCMKAGKMTIKHKTCFLHL